MSNYKIWKDENGEIMVEVFNEHDIREVQKIFIDKGYYILQTFGNGIDWFITLYLTRDE